MQLTEVSAMHQALFADPDFAIEAGLSSGVIARASFILEMMN